MPAVGCRSSYTPSPTHSSASSGSRLGRNAPIATIVLLGIAGRTPFAGVAWQVLHYLEGFRRLGHDVYYVEDTGDWPYDPEANTVTDDCRYTTRYLDRLMSSIGLGARWCYRAAAQNGTLVGSLSEPQLARVFGEADALVNLTGGTVLRDEHLAVPVRIYVETDPVLPQIEVAENRPFTVELLAAHTHHFSYGENLGAEDCGVPAVRFDYRPTRQPIVLDWWEPPRSADGSFTTVASWKQTGKDVQWNGELYTWSKHHEFLKFVDLPRRVAARLELALAQVDPETVRELAARGWLITDALSISLETETYRKYILGSRAEFTVAKDQNVRLRSGWFSDRSACYLAAGKPVVTQDTGFGNVLPTGEGLFAFATSDDAVAAIEALESDYERQSRAAREIAEEYFAAETVLARLLADAGVSP